MKSTPLYLLLLLILFSCTAEDEAPPPIDPSGHINFFGFTLIDTYWDDPTDGVVKTNYADEISSFSNLSDILIVNPSDDIVQRTQVFTSFGLKAILHLNELFFELVDTNSPSGANYDLRPDYQERWVEFKNTNQSILTEDHIAAFYIGEEPTWNGITFSELNDVATLLKAESPNIPLMIIEAYPTLNELQVPESVDWVGFDRYFIKDPNTDAGFQQDWQMLKSSLSSPSQRIMVIMDTHYIDWAHGDVGNIDLEEMGEVADNYYELAKSDERVIGILGYFWPSGFDVAESIGARGMPANVKEEYKRIGKEITEKE